MIIAPAFRARFGVYAFAALLYVAIGISASKGGDELQKLVLPHESSDAKVTATREGLLSLLSPIVPKKTSTVTITQDGRYILHGELFGGGTVYALATLERENRAEREDVSIGVGFAAWTGGRWEVRGLWRITPVWVQTELKEEEKYYPIRPAKVPLWVQDLGGDRTPEVVLVGGVDRYYQDHYVLKLSAKGTLHLAAEAMAKPALAAGMLRLHYNSGRRAIFGREEFFRWAGDTLVPVAAFHSEVPYSDPEADFVRITRYDEKGEVAENWRIASSDPYLIFREPPDADGPSVSENGVKPSPSAKVSFIWPQAPNVDPVTDTHSIENRYFWERLSGLPWSALPADSDTSPIPRLPKGVKVKVIGDPELVRRLSTEFQERITPPPVRPARRESP